MPPGEMARANFGIIHAMRIAAIALAAAAAELAPAAEVLTCARDVAEAAYCSQTTTNTLRFSFAGRIVYARDAHDFDIRVFAVEDGSGATIVTAPSGENAFASLAPGDTAEFAGFIKRRANARLESCRILSHGQWTEPEKADIADLLDGKRDFRLSRFAGTLRDVSESETASRWLMLVVCGDKERIFVSVPDTPGARDRLVGMIGHRVEATGVCVPQDMSRRLCVGRTFKVADGSDIRLAEDGSDRAVSDISTIRFSRPSEVLCLGRHSATGRIIAVWQNRHALLAIDGNGSVAGLEFADGFEAPRYGDFVMATGLPESDLFRINLANAQWTRLPAPEFKPRPPRRISAASICPHPFGYKIVKSGYHGAAISLRGIVRSLPDGENHRMHIECDGLLVPVDSSSLPGVMDVVEIGSLVDVSGTCVVNRENRQSTASFPRMDGFTLVMRTPDDIVVLKRPPWWTPRRLTMVIGGLLALLLGVVARNMAQRRNAARMAKFATDLKVEERTRLAVELHDSLAQSLTGVSLEIDTAGKLAETDPKAMREHLGQATRTLKSCRDELRNSIWDLRNRALEEASMDEAIRQTIAPHVAGAKVAVRFNVPRERLSDNTTHAILKTIREQTVNAVRHGKATRIWIAGGLDGDNLRFSVRDNGTGFDTASAPGFAEGHYGLVGITERVEALEGEFNIESTPGEGAKATISLKLIASARPRHC